MKKILATIIIVITFPLFAVVGQNKINHYEYWFDNNYVGFTSVNITAVPTLDLSTSISTTAVSTGLHTFHIRFKDDSSHYSTTISQFFYKSFEGGGLTNKIAAYEYWFDNDYASKIYTAVSPQSTLQLTGNLNASALQDGLHILHIRFKDDGGVWSTVISQFIQKVSGGTSTNNVINAYEYWFDNDYAGKVFQTVTAQSEIQLLTSIDAHSLIDGLHVFHIRFKEDGGDWSTVVSQFIQKVSGGNSNNNEINAYEYWFDNDYAGKVFQIVTAQSEIQLLAQIGAQSLTDGLHVFHVRFRDIGNSWSPVISSFFQKFGQNPAVTNLIKEYRYWFDMGDSAMINVQLPSPVDIYQLNTPINLLGIKKGNHVIHFQFLDTLKNWSCVTSDSMYRFPVVNADYTADNLLLCDSGLVNFTNESFDADTFNWKFDDGTTSNLVNPAHFFNTVGTHPVTLIAFDTLNGVIDSLIVNISVVHSPVVNLGNDTTICPSVLSLNAWNPNCTYLWSNSSTDSLININSPDSYSVTVTSQWGCIDKDTINVLFHPVPNIDLGNDTTICTGDSVILNAGSGFTSYDWNTMQSSQTITVKTEGTYIVEVTNSFGCGTIDSIHIFINPCSGINDIDSNDFVSVYPNPNNGIYFIRALSDIDEHAAIIVTDVSGRTVFRHEIISMAKDEVYQMNNKTFADGIYFLFITSKDVRIIKRIVINK